MFKRKGKEYTINIDKIKISYDFMLTSPRYTKFSWKERNFLNNGKIGQIILDENYTLVDGCCSYLIYKKHGINKVKVVFA